MQRTRPKRKSTQPTPQPSPEAERASIYRGGKDRSGDIVEISLQDLCPNPFNRRSMSGIEELAATIAEVGLLQKIAHIPRDVWVAEYPETAEQITAANVILFGEHRWRAVKTLGWESIESVLMDDKVKDARVITLIENLRRAQLAPLEEAEHYAGLRESGLSYEQIAQKVGETAKGAVSKGTVWKRIQLLSLAPEVRDELRKGTLAVSSAEQLKGMSPEDQREAATLVKAGIRPQAARAQILARQRQDDEGPVSDTAAAAETNESNGGQRPAAVSTGNGGAAQQGDVSNGNATPPPSRTRRESTNPAADEFERDRSSAAAARDAACMHLIETVQVDSSDSRELILAAMTAALLAPQQQSAAQQRALVWLRRAERHTIADQNASSYFNAVQDSDNQALQQLAAFALALATAELRTAARRHSWGSREINYVRLLQTHAQYDPSTAWEKKELGLNAVGADQ
ncbi:MULTISPECIES: ParB/RepB/Spo0J family partition protein [unclassified Streptomyces]|uniref:ParB/RepB/Spo0J family partition protein n=1 Tax=unclassified Streptomyces TaxID=2593676 RepID=UPI00082394C2|nr:MULTISPECIES: ParB/RepB/Spo0J family partition protein [unclassified Streptomyces]MYU00026.1 ParB/RepB/Spo0J family partition protein [Streptomyces sp. SID8350]SCK63203.1 ParB/RepB/Spo0J family partition protein [Streptomyces sp. AmelKG-D3]